MRRIFSVAFLLIAAQFAMPAWPASSPHAAWWQLHWDFDERGLLERVPPSSATLIISRGMPVRVALPEMAVFRIDRRPGEIALADFEDDARIRVADLFDHDRTRRFSNQGDVIPVPEPAKWVMLLAGFVLIVLRAMRAR